MALNDAKEPLNTTQISELISFHSKGRIYKISATLKDALEHRLKREGYLKGIDEKNRSLYSITPKGRKLQVEGCKAYNIAHQNDRNPMAVSKDVISGGLKSIGRYVKLSSNYSRKTFPHTNANISFHY